MMRNRISKRAYTVQYREEAVQVGARRQLEAIEDPAQREARFEELVDNMYRQSNAVNSASHLEIDAVIDPFETRAWIVRARTQTPLPGRRDGKKRPCIDTW